MPAVANSAANRAVADLVEMRCTRPAPMRRAAPARPTRATSKAHAGVTGAPIDSDECLLALMEKIQRTYTPLTDPTRLAIADAIARHLGVEYPALHVRKPLERPSPRLAAADDVPVRGQAFVESRGYGRDVDGPWAVR